MSFMYDPIIGCGFPNVSIIGFHAYSCSEGFRVVARRRFRRFFAEHLNFGFCIVRSCSSGLPFCCHVMVFVVFVSLELLRQYINERKMRTLVTWNERFWLVSFFLFWYCLHRLCAFPVRGLRAWAARYIFAGFRFCTNFEFCCAICKLLRHTCHPLLKRWVHVVRKSFRCLCQNVAVCLEGRETRGYELEFTPSEVLNFENSS